jgi:hypothetical protein
MSIYEPENYLYVYGIIPLEEYREGIIHSFAGIDQQPVNAVLYKAFAAITTPVNPQKFSQSNIDVHSKDLEWLQENAIHHHATIEELNRQFTILPMSFCTIFQNEAKLVSLLEDKYEQIYDKIQSLKDKNEWNLKVYCRMEISREFVYNNNPGIVQLKEKLQSMPAGKQFLMKKKLEHQIEEELAKEHGRWQAEIQQCLKPYINDSSLRSNWGREITGRKDDMIVNCDFLVDHNISDEFLKAIDETENKFGEKGCSFEVTGPWPPYHFSKMGSEQ